MAETTFGRLQLQVKSKLRGDEIKCIYSTLFAFCAVRKSDDTIVTWGLAEGGGDIEGVCASAALSHGAMKRT